ncbi:hypothetical protein HDK77DRAFT_225875 [Phyllosticta capitalensis]|uniref:uncharacterized protein n=1 Tax=Phyllosticta capitalensis TaxID=121624 RepID=UPI00312EDDF4
MFSFQMLLLLPTTSANFFSGGVKSIRVQHFKRVFASQGRGNLQPTGEGSAATCEKDKSSSRPLLWGDARKVQMLQNTMQRPQLGTHPVSQK